jgi:hypothetical protein
MKRAGVTLTRARAQASPLFGLKIIGQAVALYAAKNSASPFVVTTVEHVEKYSVFGVLIIGCCSHLNLGTPLWKELVKLASNDGVVIVQQCLVAMALKTRRQ